MIFQLFQDLKNQETAAQQGLVLVVEKNSVACGLFK
jgi:hypothetical protein